MLRCTRARGSRNRNILTHLKEPESFREREGCHPVLPQLEVQYSKVVEVKLGVKLPALLVNLVMLRMLILFLLRIARLVVEWLTLVSLLFLLGHI